MENNPLVSIIILSYNRKEELRRAIEKISAQSYRNIEIIVVDNASIDGTQQIVKQEFRGVKLIALQKNIGASALNVGSKIAGGGYMFIQDDDAYVDNDTLTMLVQKALEHNTDILYPKIFTEDESFCFNQHYNTGLLSFWGCAVFIKRASFEALGGFDKNIFIWGNELELTIRATENGFAIGYMPEAKAYHTKRMVPGAINYEMFVLNISHFFYIANKLFSGSERLRLNFNLALRYLLLSRKNFSLIPKFNKVWRFIILGNKNRKPVRKEIQKLYIGNFFEFANPLVLKFQYGGTESFTTERNLLYPNQFAFLNREQIANHRSKWKRSQ